MKRWSFQGPPIIFLSGGGEDMGSWKDVIPEFTDSYSIFTVDTPGQGKSSKPARSFKWKDLAEDVAQLVKQEFREPVIIVGHSLGAMIAGAVAAYNPTSVYVLVLEDPPGDISGIFPWLRGQLKIRAMPYEERIKFYMEKGKTEEEAKRASETVDKINPVAMKELMEGRAAFDIKEILPLMKCPVLFMLGNQKKGSLAQEEYRIEFRKQMPHAKISEWPETGHHLHGPDPEKFVKEIKAFLKGIQ
jgi:pimeloyl-ACP methyl ester carboxylesterase